MTERHAMFSGELSFLSNFDGTPFYLPALDATVASGEHGFNALKTVNGEERIRVLAAPHPAEAKRIGRRVTLRPDWDHGAHVWAMQRVLVAKFAIPALAGQLDATDEMPLVETNTWHDQFWGSCICPRHENAPGTNMLGELLMALRIHRRRAKS